MSTSAGQLIAARAFMGVGGALIMPSTLSILTNVFRDPKERARAIAVWAGFSGLGVALGPMTGGFLLKHFSWHSVFWVNLPIGLTALVAGYFFVPKSRNPIKEKLDPVGALLSIVGLMSLVYAIIEGPALGWSGGVVVGAFTLGVVALVAFVIWELNTPAPMLPMSFFKNPRFSAANAAVTITFFALFGSLFLMTQYWQFVQGYTPLQAGIRVIPHALVMMVTAPLSARLVEHAGTKRVVTTGLLLIAGAVLSLSFVTVHSEYWKVIGLFCVMSVGMGMTMAPATESIMGSLPRAKAGIGSALNDTTRQVGGALGVAVIGSVVSSSYMSKIDSVASQFNLTGDRLHQAEDSLSGALGVAKTLDADTAGFVEGARNAFVDAFSAGLRFATVVLLVGAFIVWKFLPARAPSAGEVITEEVVRQPNDPLPVAGVVAGD
jgi:EmrB/QacA subfamily drug resistance transporter